MNMEGETRKENSNADMNASNMFSKPASIYVENRSVEGVGNNTGNNCIIETNDPYPVCPSLTDFQRLIGCGCFCGVGMLFLLMSFIPIIVQDRTFFGVIFSFGNFLPICGLFFLASPTAHVRNMLLGKRWIAVIVFFVFFVLSIVAAVSIWSALLVWFSCFMQIVALAWYIMSYLSSARNAVSVCFPPVTNE